MYIVDFHCDSIERECAENSCILNEYNFSRKYPQLQFAAFFCGHTGESEKDSYARYKKYLSCCREKGGLDGLCACDNISDAESALIRGEHAVMLSVESADPLEGDISRLDEFYRDGVRMLGLVWNCNRYGSSSHANESGGTDTGLSELGKRVIKRCGELGILTDVSHMSRKSFYDAAEIAMLPILASHSDFYSLCAHPRNLTDDQALTIKRCGGIVGINLYNSFLEDDEKSADISSVMRHIEYGLSLLGEDYIGFGFDIDGTDGIYPAGINTASSIHDRIIEELLKHYSEEVTEKICGKNQISYLKRALSPQR